MKARCVIAFLFCISLLSAIGAERPAGQVVWWGKDVFWKRTYSEHTNGVLELGDEILSDAVEISANYGDVIALKTDGTVVGFGRNFLGVSGVPHGLSNVVSVAITGNSAWAIKRDGAVNRWGEGDEDHSGIVDGLTNVTAIAWAGYRSYLALKNDGTLVGFRFDGSPMVDPTSGLTMQEVDHSPIQQVKVRGQVLSNVVALASIMGYTPLVLQNDGTVLRLGYQNQGATPAGWRTPYHYTSADPVKIDGNILKNVVVLASGGGHVLALKSNGTVVAWGDNTYGQTNIPAGLSNVTAIAANQHLSLALKRDGTVVAWGGNYHGQASVPAGLSNVVAIAAGGMFGMAITTGSIPASVYVRPRGRLGELEREADIVFKGRVVSTKATTNASFPHWGKPHATRFQVISTLKGNLDTNELTFWHNTAGPQAWSGGSPPSWHQFAPGQSYLVFAVTLEKPAYLYTPPADAPARTNEFRQTYRDGVTRTLDDRTVKPDGIHEVHWVELVGLLNDTNPTNVLYAIERLDSMSKACGPHNDWQRSDDFKREAVLKAVGPLLRHTNASVAVAAAKCFQVGPECFSKISPHVGALVAAANNHPAASVRLAVIAALAGTEFESVSNTLSQLLIDQDSGSRVAAVRLLLNYPGEFAEHALRERAEDESADVRSVVADVIGQGKMQRLLPTLAKLFVDPVGRNPLIPPMTTNYLRAGLRWSNIGDVYTSAGLALVEFPPEPVAAILKTNLTDPGFHISFVAKLAEGDAEPWLPELEAILQARKEFVGKFTKLPQLEQINMGGPANDRILIGAYAKCWEAIRQYLLALPQEKLLSGEVSRYMDLLERMVTQKSQGTNTDACKLYELYQTKGLGRRANAIRRAYPKDEWWFDNFDRNNPGLKDNIR